MHKNNERMEATIENQCIVFTRNIIAVLLKTANPKENIAKFRKHHSLALLFKIIVTLTLASTFLSIYMLNSSTADMTFLISKYTLQLLISHLCIQVSSQTM